LTALFVFRSLRSQAWWQALEDLDATLDAALETAERERAVRAYADLVAALIGAGHESLPAAVGQALVDGEDSLARYRDGLPAGLRQAALLDLRRLRSKLETDWSARTADAMERPLPPLHDLAPPADARSWGQRLLREPADDLLDALLARYSACGVGLAARYRAFRWRNGALEGVRNPARDRLDELVGLERQLERLSSNVERFLAGSPALHTLLYGPRGSGKSSAVRSLLTRYAGDGLRLVEIGPESLPELPALSERLREEPHRFVAFVDDLSFESADGGYRPLRSLLEGSVIERPENILLIATSNRRHLVRERFSDRPTPEDDDVHAWDTSNERLALADRFGLVITFPAADQRKYLLMVRELARFRGVEAAEGELEGEAIRFAEWGNGYSGRTARQFIDSLSP
jgi:predicted AAA+ superfamily ATPase